VRTILAETGPEPRYLELELTEAFLMHDSKSTAVVLQELKEMGVQLALDDFGTGYSSLSYLKRFPIDTLKIDQSFVRDLTTDADNASIVRAVISMGESLHMLVVRGRRGNPRTARFPSRARLSRSARLLFQSSGSCRGVQSIAGTQCSRAALAASVLVDCSRPMPQRRIKRPRLGPTDICADKAGQIKLTADVRQ